MPRLRLHLLPTTLLILALLPLFCTASRAAATDLFIGVGPDSRQQLITELTTLMLEKTGCTIAIRRGGNEAELRRLLLRGEIDLCFQALPAPPPTTQEPTDIVRLPPLPFATGPVLLMREKETAALKIETISQLAGLSKAKPQAFRFAAVDPANTERLTAVYRLPIPARQPLSPSLLYRSLKNSRVDVALGQADDGRIIAFRLVALTDDRKALPALQPTPLTSKDALRRFPAIVPTIARLGEHLDSETMRRLHGGVVVAHREPRVVAREWLHAQHLL